MCHGANVAISRIVIALRQFQCLDVKFDRILNVLIPVVPVMAARKLAIFVRDPAPPEVPVKSAIVVNQRIACATIDADARHRAAQARRPHGQSKQIV